MKTEIKIDENLESWLAEQMSGQAIKIAGIEKQRDRVICASESFVKSLMADFPSLNLSDKQIGELNTLLNVIAITRGK